MSSQIILTVIPYWAWRTLERANCPIQSILDEKTITHYFSKEDLAYLLNATRYLYIDHESLLPQPGRLSDHDESTSNPNGHRLSVLTLSCYFLRYPMGEKLTEAMDYPSVLDLKQCPVPQALLGTVADNPEKRQFTLEPRMITTEGQAYSEDMHVIGLFVTPSAGANPSSEPMGTEQYDQLFERLITAGMSLEQIAASGLLGCYTRLLRSAH